MRETNPKIRFSNENDLAQIVYLCGLHAEYEKTEYKAENKKELLYKSHIRK